MTATVEAVVNAHQALEALNRALNPDPRPPGLRLVSIETVEREHIFAVLAHCRGNKTEACRVLGIDRKTLYRKLAAYKADGIE